jgi:hypothetical protein
VHLLLAESAIGHRNERPYSELLNRRSHICSECVDAVGGAHRSHYLKKPTKDWNRLMKVRTQPWSDEELKRLGAIVAAGGSPVRAAAALNRKIIGCQAQARKMGMPFTLLSVRRRMIKEKCAAAERELVRE